MSKYENIRGMKGQMLQKQCKPRFLIDQVRRKETNPSEIYSLEVAISTILLLCGLVWVVFVLNELLNGLSLNTFWRRGTGQTG